MIEDNFGTILNTLRIKIKWHFLILPSDLQVSSFPDAWQQSIVQPDAVIPSAVQRSLMSPQPRLLSIIPQITLSENSETRGFSTACRSVRRHARQKVRHSEEKDPF